MNAVEQGRALFLKRFSGRDVCLDHEFFDETVRVEAFFLDDTDHGPVLADLHALLRQVKRQRGADVASLAKRLIGAPERLQHRLEPWLACAAGLAVNRSLSLFIGELGV